MRFFTLAALLLLTLTQTACASRPLPLQAVPVLRQPVAVAPVAPPQGFRTSMSGLLGEAVELSGIYSSGPAGAVLLLRSGEQISLRDGAGRSLPQLPGIEARSTVRIRGRLHALTGYGANGALGLEVGQIFRL